jgi:CRP-like cAMP-binding protein
MHWFEPVGYLASILMFSTFYMKRMIPLRAVGMAANATFVVYSAFAHVWPLLILHACLFPLNASRMLQMMKLVSKVKEAAKGDFSMDFLVPFMTKEHHKKGDTIFKKGDPANKLYYLQAGSIKLVEPGITLGNGELIGEMGVFSTGKSRNATVVCEEDTDLYSIPDNKVLELYYQNPEFGMYLVQMILKRLSAKEEKLDQAAGAAKS